MSTAACRLCSDGEQRPPDGGSSGVLHLDGRGGTSGVLRLDGHGGSSGILRLDGRGGTSGVLRLDGRGGLLTAAAQAFCV